MKTIKAVFLLSGTAIGSGMLSLPIVLAPLGAVMSCVLILLCGFVTYLSALIRCSLNLQTRCDYTLEDVGKSFSGTIAGIIGSFSLKLLSFSLLSAYIYGFSALVGTDTLVVKIAVVGFIFTILLFPSRWILNINKNCFILLLFVLSGLIVLLIFSVRSINYPKLSESLNINTLCMIIPTLFTSFGFQGSLHTLTKFCNNDVKLIQKSCGYACALISLVYIFWVVGILTVLSSEQSDFFRKMVCKTIDVQELVGILENTFKFHYVKSCVMLVSIFTILTSIIGVGVSLVEDLERNFIDKLRFNAQWQLRWFCAIIAVLPAVVIAIIIPKAFVVVLSFSGFVLSIIAIFLPIYLFSKAHCMCLDKLIKSKILVGFVLLFGLCIVSCEVYLWLH